MPIRASQRALYPADWKEISRRIRQRDGNRCKWCAAPNSTLIARGSRQHAGTYATIEGDCFDDRTGEPRGPVRGSEYNADRWVMIVLTVAHLDHDVTNSADENLAALCQKCHLGHDRDQHQTNAAATRRGRKAAGDLFG